VQVALPARAGRLQHDEPVDAGLDLDAAGGARDRGDPVAAAPSPKGVLVRRAARRLQALPRVRHQPDPRAAHLRARAHEVLDEAHPEPLEVAHVEAASERVHRVAHRVGREHAAVVARDVRRAEVALERDVDREVGDVVTVGVTRHPHEPHARLAVVVGAQDRGHRVCQLPRYVL
jgi:hypothetical protein